MVDMIQSFAEDAVLDSATGKIKCTSKCALYDGMSIALKAPCDSSAVDGLTVSYDSQTQSFAFKDANGNALAKTDGLFGQGAYIQVVLNTTNGHAYVQNADTSKYLEDHINNKSNPHGVTIAQIGAAAASHTHKKSQITDFPTSMPASDVYSWAKASTKPSYTYSEVGAAASSHNHSASNITSGTLPAARGGTGVTSIAALATSLGNQGLPKFAMGTYTGTGTWGVNNPTSLTFSFVPKVVFLLECDGTFIPESDDYTKRWAMLGDSLTTEYVQYRGFGYNDAISSSTGFTHGKKSSDGKTFYWYFTIGKTADHSKYQFNASGAVYRYMAIGF